MHGLRGVSQLKASLPAALRGEEVVFTQKMLTKTCGAWKAALDPTPRGGEPQQPPTLAAHPSYSGEIIHGELLLSGGC